MEREHRGDGFERAGRAERVPVHRFRRTDTDLVRMRAEDFANRARFHGIVSRRARAVRVDVADRFRRDPGLAQSALHRARGAVDGRLRQMVRIRSHPESANLGVDFRAARLGRFERLKDQHRAALAQNHAAAILAEWTARIRRNHAHRFPRLQHAERENRFRAAGDGEIRVAVAHQPESLPHRVIRRRARRRNRVHRPAQAEVHRDMARSGVGHRLGNGQRMDAATSLYPQVLESRFDRRLPAHGRAADDRRPLAQLRREFDAGIARKPRARPPRRIARSGRAARPCRLRNASAGRSRGPARRFGFSD